MSRLFIAQAGRIRNAYSRGVWRVARGAWQAPRRGGLAPGRVPVQGAAMIIIAFGANLPGPDGASPAQTCTRALTAIAAIPGLTIGAVSPFYVSAPVPVSDQPPYINGVLRAEGAIDPAVLLADLLAIEARFGRRRAELNAARSLDLDIIAMGSLVRASPDPILPHPRAHERAFVLRPLADIAPDWRHPGLGATAAALLARLPPQAIERLGAGEGGCQP